MRSMEHINIIFAARYNFTLINNNDIPAKIDIVLMAAKKVLSIAK
mgnify:CR=1 FL=1